MVSWKAEMDCVSQDITITVKVSARFFSKDEQENTVPKTTKNIDTRLRVPCTE